LTITPGRILYERLHPVKGKVLGIYAPGDPFCLNPGINEYIDEDGFQIYPNPAHDKLHVIVEPGNLQYALHSVFNSIGQEIFSKEISLDGSKVFDVST